MCTTHGDSRLGATDMANNRIKRELRNRKEIQHHVGVVDLTNRFHFAVRLYSDNAQMTSKRGENKEVRYEPQGSSVTDVLTTF